MKKLLFSALLISGLAASAQTIITQANLQTLGLNITLETVDGVAIDPGPAGTSITWNFATANSLNQPQQFEFVLPSSTPHAAAFQSANLSGKAIHQGNEYTFFNISSTAYTFHGFVWPAQSVTFAYSDPLIIYTLPFAFSGSCTDNFAVDFITNGQHLYRTGTSVTTADGSGTLITPNGTYQNVLRTKRTEVYQDSANIFGSPFFIYYTGIYYEWYDNDHHMPLFSHIKMSSSIAADTYTSYYQKSAGGLGLETLVSPEYALSFYPNPVAGSGEFTYSVREKAAVKISLLDIFGKEVSLILDAVADPGMHSIPVHTHGLKAGIYFIRINESGRLKQYKISVL